MTESETLDAASGAFSAGRDSKVALFLDVDGTLLDIASTPFEVKTPPGLVATLACAERKLSGALALISGRPIEELDRLFAPLRLRASGVHGAEMRFDPASPILSAPGVSRLPPELWSLLLETLREFPGTIAENKGFSFAVHYRTAPEIGPRLRAALERLVEAEAYAGVEIINARRAFELKATGCDKGEAVARFLKSAPFLDRAPIFIGDDVTDEFGFAAVAARGGFAYSVGRRRPGAIDAFENPERVRAWLADFAREGAPE